MARTFRFPVPREERLLILAAGVCVPVIFAVLFALLFNLATANELSLGELVGQSRRLRASVAAMLVIYVAGLYAAFAFSKAKNGARLVIDDAIVWTRPATPILSLFKRDVTVDPALVDHFSVSRVRRGPVDRVELVLSQGHNEIVVNLGHAVEGDADASMKLPPKDTWETLPLVVALVEATERTPEI